MSFKWLFILFVISSCGVKGPPVPKEDAPPSLIEENYPELNLAPGSLSGE